jgi:iron complex transport system ATP-binding protein
VSDISYRYPNQSEPVFEELSLDAMTGSILAILGNNGAGKSTLLNILAGLYKPSCGVASIAKTSIASMSRREIARHIAYVTQGQRIPHLSVYDQVLLGRRPHIAWSISEYDRHVVSTTIEQLGLEDFSTRYLDELSGGERQKVHIARAIAQEPELLLLDEPTSALDPKNQMDVLEIVRKITDRSSLATILVMHDINLALRFSDRFLMMHNGAIVAYGGREVVTEETLSATYDYELKIADIDGALVAVPAKKEY